MRIRNILFLILGLTAAASAFGQSGAPRSGAVVKDMKGTLTVQAGSNPQQFSRAGMAIPVGAIVRTGANSGATLVFPDGQACALGANSTLRIANYAYYPQEPSKNDVSLNLVSGSLRCEMGEIAQRSPSAVRFQVGVVTVGVNTLSPARPDTSAVVQGESMALTVDRGSVVVFLPSGEPQPVAAGQGLFFGRDGTVVSGTAAQIAQQLGTLAQGQQMQQQFAALQDAGQNIAVTLVMLSNPATAQELLAPLDNLPPPGELAASEPPAIGAATPPTGAGGGGLPCTASCN